VVTKLRDSQPVPYHYHEDEKGFLVRCYHRGRVSLRTLVVACVVATVAFPVEHYVWAHVEPFAGIAERLGLGIGHHDDHDE
jgi:predicted RecB family nuclease